MAENEPSGLDGPDGTNFTHHMSFPPLPRLWISIFWHRTGSLRAIYLLDFHFRLRTVSFTAVPRLEVYLVCFTCLPGGVELAFFIGFLPLLCLRLLRLPLDKLV